MLSCPERSNKMLYKQKDKYSVIFYARLFEANFSEHIPWWKKKQLLLQNCYG